MRILITGASGFTGSHLTRHARLRGHNVFALSANLLDRRQVFKEVEDCLPEVVLHLAAVSFVQHSNASDFFRVNVEGTRNLLDALVALNKRPVKVLISSSASVYGNSPSSPISEATAISPGNSYAESKAQMELIATSYEDRINIIITRPFNYTGPGQSEKFLVPKIVAHFVRKEPVISLGNIYIKREFNDVMFVVQAYLALVEGAVSSGVFNVCTGVALPITSIIDLLIERTGHSLAVVQERSLIRDGEVQTLFGNPNKLLGAIGRVRNRTLAELLDSMIDSQRTEYRVAQ